jgi:hypothetical protein
MCSLNSVILASLGLIICHASAQSADLPHLRLQTWTTETHIYWVRAITPDRVAVSYFRRNGNGLDVLDSSGAIIRRVWPLPDGTYCAAVYPDGRPFLLSDDGWSWDPQIPAVVRPDGGVVALGVSPARYPSLILFDSAALDGRAFAQSVFHPTKPSWIHGLDAQPDGKVLIWGELTLADGTAVGLCRINLDETLDQNFYFPISGWVWNLRSATDGTIFVETINNVLSSVRHQWTRLNLDGSLGSSFGITFPEGTGPAITAMLNDGSVLSVDGPNILQYTSPGVQSGTHKGIWFLSRAEYVSNLVPFADGQLMIGQGAACQGGGCWAQDRLWILLSEQSGGQLSAWMPPAPDLTETPILFADGLLPDAAYVMEATTDCRNWHAVSGLQIQDFERSQDGTSLLLRDSEAFGLKLSTRFYRLRKLD